MATKEKVDVEITLAGPPTILTRGRIREDRRNGDIVDHDVRVRRTLPYEKPLEENEYIYEFEIQGGQPGDKITLTTKRAKDHSIIGGPKEYSAAFPKGHTHLFKVTK